MKDKFTFQILFICLLGFLNSINSSAQSVTQAHIYGHVYHDVNGNGIEESGEPGLPNIDIIYQVNAGALQAVTTDANGDWEIYTTAGLVEVYVDVGDLGPGAVQTDGVDPNTVIAIIGVSHDGGTDGYYYQGDVSGHLYFDKNGNGTQDSSEPDMPNVDVLVTDAFGIVQTVSTNSNGDWTANVAALTAIANVDELDPDFPALSVQTEGSDPSAVSITAGQDNFTDNDGYYEKGILTGHLYFDDNGNGTQDSSEPDMPNVDVSITDSQGQTYIVSTDANGDWIIEIPIGSATSNIDITDPDFPTGATQTEGTNPTTSTVLIAQTVIAENDGFYTTGTVTGHLYFDVNGNGIQDVGEPDMPNVDVSITDSQGAIYLVATDANGDWQAQVAVGNAQIDIDNTDTDFPLGATQTEGTDPSVTLVLANQSVFSENDGFYEEGELLGHVYHDQNGNGAQDAGEPDMPNISILITDALGNTSYTVVTDVNGDWSVLVPSGNTSVEVDVTDVDFPIGASQTEGTNPTTEIAVTGQILFTENDGFYESGSLSGHLYFDVNGNGTQDAGEADMPNVDVTITPQVGSPQTVSTDANGDWIASNVPVGSASILIDVTDPDFPIGATQTEGTNPSSTTVVINQNTFTENDGWYEVGILSGRLYFDVNNNGVQDTGEPGLDNVDVAITDALGNTSIVVTNSNGDWQATVPSGPTISNIDQTDPDFIFNMPNDITQGSNPTTTIVQTGVSVSEEHDGFYAEGLLSGHLYYDTNGNGTQDVGEPNLPNVTVNVTDIAGNIHSIVTDINGDWSITVPVDSVSSLIDVTDPDFPTGAIQTEGTNPTVSSVASSVTSTEVDGFYDPTIIITTITGQVYYDVNGNGTQDPGEPNLPNVAVEITNSIGGISIVDTDINGNWSAQVPEGVTVVEVDETDPDFITGGTQTEGTNPTTINVVTGGSNSQVDGFTLSNVSTNNITGHLYFDYNNNGTQDAGDANMPNVDVVITNSQGQNSTVTTDNNGDWVAIVPVGTTTSNIDETDTDFPTGATQTEGTDPTVSTVAFGTTFVEGDDGFYISNILITTISGHLYYDINGNGTQDAGEPDLANVDVIITDVNGGTQTVSTDANGDWSTLVPEGSTIAQIDETDSDFPIGSTQTEGTNPTTINVVTGGNNSQIDGYYNSNIVFVTYTGHLYYDTNGNGTQDTTEPNLPNVDVDILTSLGYSITVVTDANGNWSVQLPEGTTVTEVDETDPDFPIGATQTEGTNPTTFVLSASGTLSETDGFYLDTVKTATLSGHIYYDYNGNGTQDAAEANIPNLDVLITDVLNLSVIVTTDINGDWSVVVPEGNTVSVIDITDPDYPTGYIQTEGTDPTTTNVVSGSTNVETPDGFYNSNFQTGDLSGHLYYDTNSNNTQDTGEPNLPNVDVQITDSFGGTQVLTTDANGDWSVTLPEGSTTSLVDVTDPDFPTGSVQTEGTNPTVSNVINSTPAQEIDGFVNNKLTTSNLSGHVYYDTNSNSTQDVGEPDLPNIDVEIVNSLGISVIVVTDANGDWAITVPEGSTTSLVDVTDPDFPTGATQTQGTNPTSHGLAGGTTTSEIDGFSNTSVNTAVVSGHLYYDFNGNATQDSGEPDLANIDVSIYTSLGFTIIVSTDNSGDWSLLVTEGSTTTTIDLTDPDFPTGVTQTEGTNPTIINVVVGAANSEIDGFYNPNLEVGELSGHIYYDTNGNSTQDIGEPDLANIPVLITDSFGGTYNLISDTNGDWIISVPTGNTTSLIDETAANFPVGATQTEGTNPTTTNVTSGSSTQEFDGYTNLNLGTGDINGHLYYDANGNATQDSGEPDLPNVSVAITLSVGSTINVVTDVNGDWKSTVPEGNTTSLVDETDVDFIIGAVQTEGTNPTVTNVIAGNIFSEVDGYEVPLSELGELSGHMYIDANGNGVQDNTEPDLANVDIVITDFLGGNQTLTSDVNGDWFANVISGQTTSDIDETDPDFPSVYIQTEGTDPTVTQVTQTSSNFEFDGFFSPEYAISTLNGHVYFDTNGNSTQDVGEIDLANIDVEVSDQLGLTQTVSTDINGNWSTGVPLGDVTSYVLINNIPAFSDVVQSEGTNPTNTTVAGNMDYYEIDGYYIDELTPNDLKVFNAISPNDDGQNDYLIIEGIENFPDNKLIIFNRWGTKVFDVSGYGQDNKYFRGYSEGRVTIKKESKLPAGTYFYILEVNSNSGETMKKEGYLYIN
ncbi:gliding motility-associated C-terminal domain-containing protein [Mesonia phycicola]|uniref:Gliding motility-associated C-terminal domain-containing protein n=1 Tax=Mesonia phycicola TaxID=579105 RepID=A0A1M6GFW8_9FLAO|nr:gliding motility-associated C-terminal domain-containing protein [Mesonia phycicola]SHJ08856.1 gliding motility-associated C-terminal domain-containing protein [Mesonia phycicola]